MNLSYTYINLDGTKAAFDEAVQYYKDNGYKCLLPYNGNITQLGIWRDHNFVSQTCLNWFTDKPGYRQIYPRKHTYKDE